MPDKTDETVLAERIENDTDPADHARAKDTASANDGEAAARDAAHKGIAEAVAKKLESDGYPEAATMVRSYSDDPEGLSLADVLGFGSVEIGPDPLDAIFAGDWDNDDDGDDLDD